MNIVFVTDELATGNNSLGGLASFTSNISRIFRRHGHDVSIIVVTTKEEHFEFDSDITLVTCFVELNKWKNMKKIADMLSHVCKYSPNDLRGGIVDLYKSKMVTKEIRRLNEIKHVDLVHYCNLEFFAMFADRHIPYCVRLSSFMNILRGAELPIAKLGYLDTELNFQERLTDYVVRKSKYVISPSFLIAKIAEENLNVKATVLESPYIIESQRWDYRIYDNFKLKNRRYIIHYGRMQYVKGTQIVAQIASKLLEEYPDLYIILAGNSGEMFDNDGNKIMAHELVIRNAGKFADRVIYVGKLTREQLFPFIQYAELCLLPSRIENLSNACIEAMAMGKIVVATDGASFEQLIEDRVSGFLCERDNPDSFFKAVEEGLNMSYEDKCKMSKSAMFISKRLSPDNVYEKYLEYYKKVVSEWRKEG